MKKLLLLLQFAIARTPEIALQLLQLLKPARWVMTVDGTVVQHKTPSFKLGESFALRCLVFEIEYQDALDAVVRKLLITTRFKNDGTDVFSIDGKAQILEPGGFDFDCKPLKKDLTLEIRHTDETGIWHEITLSNTF